jgi:hypothetical protein
MRWLCGDACADAGVGRDVSAKCLVRRVADPVVDLCAGGRAGSVELGLAFAVVVRISSAVRVRGSCVLALNWRSFWVHGSSLRVFCESICWCFRPHLRINTMVFVAGRVGTRIYAQMKCSNLFYRMRLLE